MNNKLSIATLIGVVLVLAIQGLALLGGGAVGGTTNYDLLSTLDGYAVDGTVVVDTNGLFVGTVSGTISTINAVALLGTPTTTIAHSLRWTDVGEGFVLRSASSGCILFIMNDAATLATSSVPCT